MFCSECYRKLFYKNLENRGWCERCKHVVETTPCNVSYWCVAAVMLMPWLMSAGAGR